MKPAFLATAMLVAAAVAPTTPHAQDAPKFAVDPTWPKDLPKDWITGQLGGVCVDSRDNVYVVNRRNITDEEKQTSISAPSIIKFNANGDVAIWLLNGLQILQAGGLGTYPPSGQLLERQTLTATAKATFSG